MFERFTEPARRCVVLAADEARLAGANEVCATHLLAGIAREGEGVGFQALRNLGLGVDEFYIKRPPEEPKSSLQAPFTPALKAALELALRESLQLGHNYIGTEHLLLGLVRHIEIQDVLKKYNISGDDVRREVVKLLGGGRARNRSGVTGAILSPSLSSTEAAHVGLSKRRNKNWLKRRKPGRVVHPIRHGLLHLGPVHITVRAFGEGPERVVTNILWRDNRQASIDVRFSKASLAVGHWLRRTYKQAGEVLPRVSVDVSHWHTRKDNKQPPGGWQPSNRGVKKLYDAGLYKYRKSS